MAWIVDELYSIGIIIGNKNANHTSRSVFAVQIKILYIIFKICII